MATNHSLVLYDPQETSKEVKAAAGFRSRAVIPLVIGHPMHGRATSLVYP